MKNKVLVKILIPQLMDSMEMFIPVNERISKIIKLISKTINEKTGVNKDYCLIDVESGTMYDERMIVRDTNIINAKTIILM